MSTIAVVRKNGQAVIAADTLTKRGSLKEPAAYVVNHQKILRVGDSYLAVCGPMTAQLVLEDYFSSAHAGVNLDSVPAIFRAWLPLHQALKDHYFLRPEEDEEDDYESSRMCVVIANAHGIFGIAAYREVQEFTRFYSYGMGCDYAMGAMYAGYDDPGRSAEDVARLGVEAAAEFDDSTGLPVLAYTVALREP